MNIMFVMIAAWVVVLALVPAVVHQVHEGYVGVYWRGGALLKTIAEPGFHIRTPIITTFAEVQVTVQTDSVVNIPCGTSGGVMVTFDKVEVVNRLDKQYVYETVKNYSVEYDKTWIFDKIHHEINQFCSSHTLREVYIEKFDTLDESLAQALQRDANEWAPGIEVIGVRVTKPRIPDSIRRNFELMEAEKTKLLIATQVQKVLEMEAETQRKEALIHAQKESDVSRINMKKQIEVKESQREVAQIENDMHLARERALADAEFYHAEKEADVNVKKLTPEYLEFVSIRSMANNSKIFFGEKIPSMYVDRQQQRQSELPKGA